MEDRQLARLAAQGDQEAFTTLFERYREWVYTLAYKIALDREDARDVTQTVFLRLSEKIGQYSGKGKFRSWLATMVVRTAIDFTRAASRREVLTEEGDFESSIEAIDAVGAHAFEGPRESAEREERLARVEKEMKRLSAQQRAILVLRLREDLGTREIADHLAIPEGQVRTQTHRAIAKLKQRLDVAREPIPGGTTAER